MMNLKPLLISISFATLGIIGFYILRKRKLSRRRNSHQLEITVPNHCVPFILGRYGCAVKTLQEKCSTRIIFIPPEYTSDTTKCIIKGNPEDAELAANIIKNIIQNYENEHETSNIAKISKLPEKNNYDLSKSNYCSPEAAEVLSEYISKILNSSDNHDVENTNEIIPDLKYEYVKHISEFKDHYQKLQSLGGDNLIPVYVSAVATPQQFWIQAHKTKEHAELDQLTQELYDYYDFNPDYNHPPEYETIKVGNLYAVFFNEDKRWYRAEICQIPEKDQENPLNTMLDVYFLDFGESVYQKLKFIRILPPQFLELKFQAIECSIANIKPINDEWHEEDIVAFEELTRCAQWYSLQARVEYSIEKKNSSASSIPCLTLIDANFEDLNINNEMVNSGHAIFST